MPCGHFSLRSLIPATPSIDSGKAVMSVLPVRSWSAGDARSSSTTTDTIVIDTGRAITHVTARPQKPLPSWTAARRSSQANR